MALRPELKRFPPDFSDRLNRIIPPGLMHEVSLGLMQDKPTTFRINTLKASEADVIRNLEKIGLEVQKVREIPLAYRLLKGSQKKLMESRSYEEGALYLQSLSSQIPALVLDPQPGDKILDMAAAPGGKTCQMAAMMANKGEITAIEPEPIRYERLCYNLKKQGVENTEALRMRGEKLEAEGIYDRILLDAPCSSEGTFVVKEPGTFRHWDLDVVIKSARVQEKLLKRAISLVRPGGVLVYSTCALSPEENEAVVDACLKENPEITTEPITFKFPFLKPSMTRWENRVFSGPVAQARRIYPSPQLEGFFVCKLKRRD